jgi:ribosomal protein S18 acetylase RimI-like enzyme
VGTASTVTIRRELREADPQAIADLHRAVYATEYGLGERFVRDVADGVATAIARGWPERSGAAWLIGEGGRLSGCLALTDEGGYGRVHWFVLAPALRGQGLGRRLLDELLNEARDAGHAGLELETFSALTAAARIYRDAGFRVAWERDTDMWGPPIVLQHYELGLR